MTNEKLDRLMKNYVDRDTQAFAYHEKKHRGLKAVSVIAAALVLIIALVLALPIIISSENNRVDTDSTMKRYIVTVYSYREDKLLQLCNTDISDQNANKLTQKNRELFERVGAGVSGVEYADENKVVFTTGKGVFVYDYHDERILLTFDLDTIGVPGFNQGDSGSYIQVDNHGEYAILTSSEDWIDNENREYHILDFLSGESKRIDKKGIPDDFSPAMTEAYRYYPKSDADDTVDLPASWHSSHMASYIDENDRTVGFYTNIERDPDGKVIVGNMDLVIVQPDRSYRTQRVFASLYPEFGE